MATHTRAPTLLATHPPRSLPAEMERMLSEVESEKAKRQPGGGQ